MSDKVCKFCAGLLDPVQDRGSDTCEGCWYEMRLEPEAFERTMRGLGVEIRRNGHGFTRLDDGSVVHINRIPYRLASEPAPVNPTRAEVDQWLRDAEERKKG